MLLCDYLISNSHIFWSIFTHLIALLIEGMKIQIKKEKKNAESAFEDPRSSARPHARAWIIQRALKICERSKLERATPRLSVDHTEMHEPELMSHARVCNLSSSVASIKKENLFCRIRIWREDLRAYKRGFGRRFEKLFDHLATQILVEENQEALEVKIKGFHNLTEAG